MPAKKLELDELGQLVFAERERRGMSLREAASDIGIPFNTLARVERGHVPDLPKFKRLVEWSGADIQQFFERLERATATTDLIAEHLHADTNLPPEAADRIASLVNDLYEALAEPREVSAVHLRASRTFRPEASRIFVVLLNDLHEALLKESEHAFEKRV